MPSANRITRQALRSFTPYIFHQPRLTSTVPFRPPFATTHPSRIASSQHFIRPLSFSARRPNSNKPSSEPIASSTTLSSSETPTPRVTQKGQKPEPPQRVNEPTYQLTFTCKACESRSAHTISKQGYHSGTVLVQCPSCKNRHLISDHLKIFSDKSVTIEQILAERGQSVQRGTIDQEGDMEFWDKPAPE